MVGACGTERGQSAVQTLPAEPEETDSRGGRELCARCSRQPGSAGLSIPPRRGTVIRRREHCSVPTADPILFFVAARNLTTFRSGQDRDGLHVGGLELTQQHLPESFHILTILTILKIAYFKDRICQLNAQYCDDYRAFLILPGIANCYRHCRCHCYRYLIPNRRSCRDDPRSSQVRLATSNALPEGIDQPERPRVQRAKTGMDMPDNI
jgi:hypothetical protein